MWCREKRLLASRVLGLQPMAEALRGEIARGVAGQAQGFRNGRAQQRISQSVQHEGKGALRNVVLFMTCGQMRDEAADRIEDRVKRITIACQDHPGGQRTGTFFAEGVKASVNDLSGVGLA